MIVVHFESGLGNQMLNYAEFLAAKKNNNEVFCEKMFFDLAIPKGYSMWNGYELEKVFGIKIKDVSTLFSRKAYDQIKSDVYESHFWENNWKYSKPVCDAFFKQGLVLQDETTMGKEGAVPEISGIKKYIKSFFCSSNVGDWVFRLLCRLFSKHIISHNHLNLFYETKNNIYCGQTLKFMYKGEGIELIEEELRHSFKFQNINKKNLDFINSISNLNTISIHVRRGDFLSTSGNCYKYGYFKRAVSFIKRKIEHPVFVFFSDLDSREWLLNNLSVFGIDEIDTCLFVDWNNSANSYQDMYLMSQCKHNIITQSSFGWWGSWLNNYPKKITISPNVKINTKYWF